MLHVNLLRWRNLIGWLVSSYFFILCSWQNYPGFYCTHNKCKSRLGPPFLARSHWISYLAVDTAQCLCCDALSPPGPTCRFWSAPTHPWPPRPPCCRGVDRSTSSVTVLRRYITHSAAKLFQSVWVRDHVQRGGHYHQTFSCLIHGYLLKKSSIWHKMSTENDDD